MDILELIKKIGFVYDKKLHLYIYKDYEIYFHPNMYNNTQLIHLNFPKNIYHIDEATNIITDKFRTELRKIKISIIFA